MGWWDFLIAVRGLVFAIWLRDGYDLTIVR